MAANLRKKEPSVLITGRLSGNNEADRQRIIKALKTLDDVFPGKISSVNVKMQFNKYASGEPSDFDLRLTNLSVTETEAADMTQYLLSALRREGIAV